MTSRPLVIVGDTLLDVDLDAPAGAVTTGGPSPVVDDPVEHVRPGGAALAALIAARGPRAVALVTALSDDTGGQRLRDLLEAAGITVVDIGLSGPTPQKLRLRSGRQTLLQLNRDRWRPAAVGALSPAAMTAIRGAAALLISDYGGLVPRAQHLRECVAGLGRRVPLTWDPHRRGGDPVPGTLLVTPNADEAAVFSGAVGGGGTAALIAQGRALANRWRVRAVAITRSDQGALLVAAGGSVMSIPTASMEGDDCGAGDSFATAAALQLAGGAPVDEAVTMAVEAATRFVAAGGVAAFHPGSRSGSSGTGSRSASSDTGTGSRSAFSRHGSGSTLERVRAGGGTVVATGGCFDLLHAGHLSVLRGARALGDCLIVCLNSDASVRGLKGPGRPVVPQGDREAVLRALEWVDDVIVFDDPTSAAVLLRIRPDIWAKGGDYAVDDIPEAGLVRGWGGQVVTLPHRPGHSTTRLLEQLAHARL